MSILKPLRRVGLILDGTIDDEEIAELFTESYCILAPKKCAALVHGDARD